jgi:Zn-finger nucleic acid-binding protein
MPEQARQRAEQQLQALLRGDHVDRGELQSLMTEARQLAERHPPEEPRRIDRARLEEDWRQVEELVQRMRQTMPWKKGEEPSPPESR